MPRTIVATVLAVLVAVASAGGGAASAGGTAPAPVALDGIRIDGTTHYELVDRDRVHVVVEVRLTNTQAPRIVGRFVESSVLDVFAVPVLAEAQAVTVTQQGSPRPVDLADDAPRVSFVVVDLEPDLEYGNPQTVVVEYDLAPQPPRSDSFVRINPAFVSFPLFAVGDPAAADVVVSLPEGLDVTFVGEQPVTEGGGPTQVFRFDDVAAPEGFTATVAGRDDDALVSAPVELAGVDVTVRAWPDDPAWAEFVSGSLREGIPALEQLIGRQWPADGHLDVVESASPYLYGYSGWFRPAQGVIEIGDELDDQVVLHELAHLWFNDGLFEGRWISEGLAESYAARVRAGLGRAVEPPAAPGAGDPGAQPLEQWGTPNLTEAVADAHERYGYAASHLVVDRLVAAAGEDGMRSVLDAAARREISYLGDGPAEQVEGAPGWRRLLDLVEERTPATGVGDLFARYVTAGSPEELVQRSDQRTEYEALAAEGAGWSPPLTVRRAMTAWDFDAAAGQMTEARNVLARRDILLTSVAPLGIRHLPGLESRYEHAGTVAEMWAALRGHEHAAPVLLRAMDRLDGADGPLAWIGLLGDPAGDHLDRAVAALEGGDVDRAEQAARAAIDAQRGAARRGVLRLVAASAIVGTALAGWLALRSADGRRRPPAHP